MIAIVRADSNFPNDMPCSISLNFTLDKISVNFLVDSEEEGEYNPKKMPENRRKNNYDDYKTAAG